MKLGYVGFGLLALATTAMMNVASLVIGRLVDVIAGESVWLLPSVPVALGLLALGLSAEMLGRTWMEYLINIHARARAIALRTQALGSVLAAPVPTIMELGTGNVITRISKDIDTVVTTVTNLGVRVVVTAVIVPVTAVSLALIHPAYLLLFVAAGVVLGPSIRRVVRDMPAVTYAASDAEAHRNNILLDTIRALETLRVYRLADWATARMERVSWATVQRWGDKIPLMNRLLAQGNVAFGILLLGSLVMSMPMVAAGWITPGQAAAAVLLMMRLEIHVFNLLFFAGEIQHAVTAYGRARELAELADATLPPTDTLPGAPHVEVSDLRFAYPGGEPVLDGVSVTLEAGTTTALVGTSGAGKSTLAALVAGLQYPTGGRIVIGGVDTASVPNIWLARNVALVTQEVHLFSGTVRDDLLLARADASDAELLEALRVVGLDARWLPEGLDTLIGAGNPELSPEAAQQISLARMLLRQPPVLIMDEATSEAGEALEEATRRVAAGRTTLVVAHRLDQARTADRILVMEAGQIIEDGTHDELLARGGRYARAYAQWAGL